MNKKWNDFTVVSSWEGSKSHLDIEKEHDYSTSRKRLSEDEYEEELDRGRVSDIPSGTSCSLTS